MPRFALEENISNTEIQHRVKAELEVELLQTKAPRLLAAIDVVETMIGLGFRHTGNHRDSTFMFDSGEFEVFVRRDWAYAGVAYHVCLWSDAGRPYERIGSARRLKRAVRSLIAAHEFRSHAAPTLAQALHHRLGAAAAIRVLGPDGLRMCLVWV
jgi:hypothetical protein